MAPGEFPYCLPLNHLNPPLGVDPGMLAGEVIDESPSSLQLLGEQLAEPPRRILNGLCCTLVETSTAASTFSRGGHNIKFDECPCRFIPARRVGLW